MAKVAVVILNYNGEEVLRRFLPSVVVNSAGVEVVVADNASTDGSLLFLKDNYPQVRLIALESNYGFAGGYNRALAMVDAEYFLLLNSDVEVTHGWIEPLVAFMDSTPGVAACQPKILSYKSKRDFEYAGASGGMIDRYGYPYCRGRLFSTVEEDKGQYDDILPVFWASGAAMRVRSADFRSVGGFDERFFAHMEEIDLCWRMASRGLGVYAVPQSVVYHVGGATLDKGNPRKTYLNFRNNLLMLYKNLPEEELCRVLRVRLLLDCVAACRFLFTFAWGDFCAVVRARRDYRKMKKEYRAVRADNIAHSVTRNLNGMSRFSILWEYYVRRKKYYSQLHK